jgi:hypothetical protein
VFLIALKHASIGQVINIIRTAVRAEYLAVRPAQLSHERFAILEISEVDYGLLQGLRCFAHESSLKQNNLSVKYILTNIYARKLNLNTKNTPVGGQLGELFCTGADLLVFS